jgi:hypothetical protein
MKRSHVLTVLTAMCLVLALVLPVSAQYVLVEDVKGLVKESSYSPYGGRNFPTNVYWGDTHLMPELGVSGSTPRRPSASPGARRWSRPTVRWLNFPAHWTSWW